ncbi:MAG: hypothetical protein KIT43_04065 [Bauldia sp.]|nr:hypothetical protein [Bauldia sp.]
MVTGHLPPASAAPIFLRPVRTALFFGVVPPLAGVAIPAVGYFPATTNLGPYAGHALTFVAVAGYVMGAPPLAATGAVVGLLARRGRSTGELLALATVIGLWFGAASAIAWQWSGGMSTGAEGLVALTLASGLASFAAALLLAWLVRWRRRKAEASSPH